MSLVITGAGGQLGRLTAELVLAQPQHDELVLVTRRPATLSELASRGGIVRGGDSRSGMAWTFLRNALYSEFRVPQAQAAIAHGAFTHNFGDAHHAFVSR